jgi:lipopolysaccharide/colanic/teichoic acid biosynthesis glycosyltransferase
MYKEYFKRLIELIISICGLVLLMPIILLCAIALWVSNSDTPFFIQPRPGKNAKVFKLIKFKTMSDNKDESGKLLPDVQRTTKVGKFIRSYSLDELPQLLNILRGDMSLIGPRPLLVKYLDLYTPVQARRHDVKPGITGWAQVNGRNTISWEEKFKLDVWYVDNLSFKLDLKILYLTFLKVIKKEAINASSNFTMKAFEKIN